MNQLIQVPFRGDVIEATQDERGVFVSLRRCCENLGLAMEGQLAKLKRKSWAVMKEIVMTASDGKQYPMVGISLDTLPGWLFSIEARKVREEMRERLLMYQKDAANALADHFFGRKQQPVFDPQALIAAVEAIIARMLPPMVEAIVRPLLACREPAPQQYVTGPSRGLVIIRDAIRDVWEDIPNREVERLVSHVRSRAIYDGVSIFPIRAPQMINGKVVQRGIPLAIERDSVNWLESIVRDRRKAWEKEQAEREGREMPLFREMGSRFAGQATSN